MPSRYAPFALAAFATAGALAFGVAVLAATQIEDRSVEGVGFAMREEGIDWITVTADGLQVRLDGIAPDEAARFRAVSLAGQLVDGDRIVDRLEVTAAESFTPPAYALEMLRNDDGISLIGLVPESMEPVANDVPTDMGDGTEVVDMVETAAYPAPDGWQVAVDYGLRALRVLPRAKISVTEGRVEIEAVSESPEERAEFIATLERATPRGLEVVLDISAPRPVITPFTLRFVRTPDTARFEACSADTEDTSTRILDAAIAAGLSGPAECEIGLGIPSPNWAMAVELALASVAELGEATVTFSDADVTLIAAQGTDRDLFDRVIGDLDAELPEVFSLHGVLPDPPVEAANVGPPNFTATLSAEGPVELSGRLPDARIEEAVRAFARAQFGHDNVRLATRRVDDLPTGWSTRVLAGLGALGHLESGTVRIEPELLRLTGETGSQTAVSDITRLLGQELGEAANFEIDVAYVEALDPAAAIPEPDECVARIASVLEATKITFDPGSVEINETAGDVLDAIAAILPDCRHVPMEIGGHTDSQGRETMNLRLSQSRADAVLNGLMGRNILIGNLSARGYGETRPIAENDSEDGREINRRIEFRLLSEVEAANAVAEAEIAAAEDTANPPTRPVPAPRPDPEPAPEPEPEPEADPEAEAETPVAEPDAPSEDAADPAQTQEDDTE